MLIFYNFFLRSYFLLAKILAPFNKKAKLFTRGRKDLFINLQTALKTNQNDLAWFHCASLGEFEQARPVIEAFRSVFPKYSILLTFFSPSGYEIRKNYSGADYVFYIPMDSRENAKRFINTINPAIAYFTKYEFWFYFLDELQKRNIPTICFSAKFRKDQIFFKNYGGFYRSFLKKFSHLFVQDDSSLKLLKGIGIDSVTIAGDTRFDRVFEISEKVKPIDSLDVFLKGSKAFIIGSSWKEDLEVLIPFINDHQDRKFIIAPHEIHEEEIVDICKKIKGATIRYTDIEKDSARDTQVLILDTIGQLSRIYQYGDYAYIGGGFGKGIHNILEAATFSMPVIFGPNYYKFQEAKDLVNIKSAFPIKSLSDLEEIYNKLEISNNRLEAGIKSRQYVVEKIGATGKIIEYTKRILTKG